MKHIYRHLSYKQSVGNTPVYDDVINWKHFARSWPFVRGIHRSPVNSPHKGQWRGALMIFFICASANGWVNNWDTGDLRRYSAHYGVTVMCFLAGVWITQGKKFSKTWIKIKDLSFKKTHLKISSAKWMIKSCDPLTVNNLAGLMIHVQGCFFVMCRKL